MAQSGDAACPDLAIDGVRANGQRSTLGAGLTPARCPRWLCRCPPVEAVKGQLTKRMPRDSIIDAWRRARLTSVGGLGCSRPREEAHLGRVPWSRSARRTLKLFAASLMAVGWAGGAVSTTTAASPAARETAISAWDDAAAANGAIGTYYDESTGELVALLPASHGSSVAAADASSLVAKASSAGLAARVEPATIDKATIDGIQSALLALRFSIPLAYNYAFYFDPSKQKVVLQSNAPAESFASVTSKYGDHVQYSGTGVVTLSRMSDGPPHYGGADVVGPDEGTLARTGCTTGFSVIHNGATYMLTAGHCFRAGSTNPLYNYHCTNTGSGCTSIAGGGYYMGYVSWQGGPSVDAELISGSAYSGYIYTSATAYKPVAGAGDPVVNATGYCVSGAYSQTNCGHTDISSTGNICETIGSQRWCVNNLSIFQYGVMPTWGDSGSPVYLDAGSEVAIRASVIALGYGTFYAEPWSQLYSYFGISIVNG